MDARSLARELGARLGDKAKVEGTSLRAIVQHGDAFLATRIRVDPTAEIFVATRPLAGFTLAIRWGDRWRDPDTGDRGFDDAFALATNDEPLMRAWLDAESRRALLASPYAYEATSDAEQPPLLRRTWTYELANDELVATKGAYESDPARFLVAIETACAIAARSQRWAAEYAGLARALGGHAASEVELGGAPLITVTRAAIEVTLRLVRARGLHTVISAPRIGEARYVLDRARGYRTAAKLDDLTHKLVAATEPLRVEVDGDSVDVWFAGTVTEHARIDAAVTLAAHLAVDAIAAQGPYR